MQNLVVDKKKLWSSSPTSFFILILGMQDHKGATCDLYYMVRLRCLHARRNENSEPHLAAKNQALGEELLHQNTRGGEANLLAKKPNTRLIKKTNVVLANKKAALRRRLRYVALRRRLAVSAPMPQWLWERMWQSSKPVCFSVL